MFHHDTIWEVPLSAAPSRFKALDLVERGLISQFTRLYPFLKSMDSWMKKNLMALIKGNLSYQLCGRWFYTFFFELKEDINLIFRNGPYFMDTRGMYLNKWTPNLNPQVDDPSLVLVWFHLPHLPFHYWNNQTMTPIWHVLGTHIDRSNLKVGMSMK